MNIVSAVILCTIVGAVGAIVLVAAAKFMAVEEDPRIEEVSACLAGANCGGCGYAGCADYAKAVVLDGVPCDKCAPGGPKAAAAIAKIMGGEASAVEKKAVVQCQGSSEHCKPAYDYKGIQTCAAAAALYGGPKSCSFACIGLGDCTKVCKFDAIHIVDGVAKVDKDKCTGCGACANICPKQVIMIDAAGPRKPVVMCSNKDKGAVANKLCTTSCIACGMCERTCKFDAIHVVDGVARIDYDKCKGCGRCIGACSFDAIYSPNDCANELLDRKMAEYAAAVCAGRPCFHISLVQDISPNCDCHGENDAPILPDIGIFASFDPVALDQASVDACLSAAPLPNSQLSANLAKPGWNCYHDNFKDSNPNIEWKATLEQAEKLGMGTRQYVLKKV